MGDFLLDKSSKLLSLELQRDGAFLVDKNIIPSHVFSGLFEGRTADEETLLKQLHYLPWVRSAPFSVLVITGKQGALPDSKIPLVIQAVKAFLPAGRCTVHAARVVAFLDEGLRQELTQKRREEFADFLRANGLHAGISMAFDGIALCGKYYSQAEKAAAHAQRRERDFLLFEDCALFLLCELIQSEYDMMDFTHPAVTALMKADAKTGSELLATLKYYIFYSHAPNEAARVLNIHRNTLFYRINKIREMTGISFDTVEDTFRIYLSIRLLETSSVVDIG